MHALQRLIQRHARAAAWTLALALLLSTAWGQMHRVVHAGLQTSAGAVAAKSMPGEAAGLQGLADEEGGGLCKLLDQLTLGAGLALAQASIGLDLAPVLRALAPAASVWALAVRRFDARGPPTSA